MNRKIARIRAFNRFYTNYLGLLNNTYLGSDISLTECRLLFEIGGAPGCRAKDLTAQISIDPGYLSRLLSRLERAGLIERRTSEADGREKQLMLTADGGKLLTDLNRKTSAQIEAALQTISARDQDQLVQAMQTIEKILS